MGDKEHMSDILDGNNTGNYKHRPFSSGNKSNTIDNLEQNRQLRSKKIETSRIK